MDFDNRDVNSEWTRDLNNQPGCWLHSLFDDPVARKVEAGTGCHARTASENFQLEA